MSDYHNENLAPHSLEAEEAVLGSILLDESTLAEVTPHITAADFFIIRNGWIFESMVSLQERGEPVDHLTVVNDLEVRGRIVEAGGAAYVISLYNKTPSSLNVTSYARIVSQMAYRRRMINIAQEIARLAHSEQTSLTDIHTQLGKEFAQLSGPQVHTFATSEASFSRFIDRKMAQAVDGRLGEGFTTGLPTLDQAFGGDLSAGVYNILYGPTGVGKTWAMLQMALSIARHCPVVYVSLENIEDTLVDRMVALESEVPYSFVKKWRINGQPISDHFAKKAFKAASDLSQLPLEMVYHLTSASQIEEHLKSATIRHGRVGLCFVDTLNQLADAVGRDKRYENLTKASAQLLQTMRLTGWGIVAGAQMRINLTSGMSVKKATLEAWPNKNSLEGARTVVQHVRNMVGMFNADYVAREIHNDNYSSPDCPTGCTVFVNVKANDNPGDGEGVVAWRPGIPKFAERNMVDINTL